ncbi:hypothetical protein WA026_016441 [Henosepilachna vigintioctopunctata]|uniref:Telomerase reverse transcriptase n=1 Tax=Henosepilachna vigintioctopunctata TaxID=420089 RepID=A0AAW1UNG4_9CUCU
MPLESTVYPLHLRTRESVNYKILKAAKMFKSLSHIKKQLRHDNSVIFTKKEIINILKRYIPKRLFDTENNYILFFRLIKKLINQRKHEFVHVSLLHKGFDNTLECSTECRNLVNFQEVQKNINLFLLEKCVKPFVKKHFVYVLHPKSYRVDLIPNSKWQFFRDRIIHQMKLKKHIIVKKKSVYVARGALQILPKDNCENLSYRPLIRYFKNTETKENLIKINNVKKKLKTYLKLENVLLYSLHESWSNFVTKERGNIIYGIKADVEDCFGSINIHLLIRIIQELPCNFSDSEKLFLINRIKQQYVRIDDHKKRCLVQWCHGLLQGDRLSSVLCDLYYLTLVDKKIVKEKAGNNFFHRVVDDYIFCSTIKNHVQEFMFELSNSQILNQRKIYSNLNKEQVELPYCGYVFNLITKEVQIMFDLKRTSFRDKFKLWYDYINDDPEKYLKYIMRFSSANFYFSKIIFDTHYNTEETILKSYFHSMLYLAMKFDCAFMELKQYHPEFTTIRCDKIKNIITDIIKYYSNKTFNLIKKWQGPLFYGQINMKTLNAISLRAFILIFRKKEQVYGNILKCLKGSLPMKIEFLGGFNKCYIKEIPINMRTKKMK